MQYHELAKSVINKKDELAKLLDGLEEMEMMDDDEKIQYRFADSFFLVTVAEVGLRSNLGQGTH